MTEILLILLSMLGWCLLYACFSLIIFKWLFPLNTQKEMKLHDKRETKLLSSKELKSREVLFDAGNVKETL